MEESAPKIPAEDILTPQDSLESTNTMTTVTPTQGTSLEGAATLPPPTAPAGNPSPIQPVAPELPDAAPQKHIAGFMQNKLLRKVGLTSAILLGFILLIVGATFIYQKTHAPQLSEADKLAQIKDQTIQLSGTDAAGGPSSLRVGVATMFVNGDISLQGILRFSNGANYGQFDGTSVTGTQTYRLPNASGTICLDSGNCGGVTAAQLAALGVSVAALNSATQSAQAATNSGVQSINGLVGTISLQGTVNQITITEANGTVTLALPQDIAFDSAPAFGGLTLSGTGTQNGYQLCDDSNNCGFARGDMAILQGGNAYNTEIIVGAYDNYGLSLITNNTERINITNNGLITLGGSTTDRLTVLAELKGNRPLVFQGLTDDFFRTTLVVTDPTANRNIILPNADGTICLTSGNCSGAGGYGDILNGGNTLNSAISIGTNDNFGLSLKTFNTTRLSITNTGSISLLGDTAISANVTLGASSSSRVTILGQILGGTPLVFQGATNDSFATSFVISDPTANRTIVFPNADGTVCLSSGNCSGIGGSGDILQGGNNFTATMVLGTNDDFGFDLKTNNTPRLSITNTGNATFSADLVVNGSVTLGDTSADRVTVNGQVRGGTPFVFQGATDNAFATFFTVADPTANRTIIVPNADGTICLSSGNCSTSGGTGDVNNGGNNYNSTMTLGTNDNFGLTFKTNNTDRITISNTGLTTVIADFVVNGNTLLGADSSNSTTLQGTNLFAPNDLNIDTYTQYIDTLNNTVGFGLIPGASSRVSILSNNGGDALTVNNGTGAGNILNLQDNGVNVVTVANGGYTTFRNTVDSVGAFQIQNAVGSTLLNADTVNRTIAINNGPSTYTYTNPGPLFASPVAYPIFASRGVTYGNFNNDSSPDIVYSSGVPSVYVAINNGNGTFASAVQYTTGNQTVGIATADFNGDNRDDIVAASSSGAVVVLMNNGNGTFAPKTDHTPVGGEPISVAVGDINDDGDLDIVSVGGTPTGQASVFMGDGNGGFAAAVGYTIATGPSDVSIADVNLDGDLDVVALSRHAPASVLINNGDGTFATAVDYTTSGINESSIVMADFNNDTYPDIATSGFNTNLVSILLNNGDGTFATKVDYAGAGGLFGITSADINSDGHIDLVTSNQTAGNISVFLNNGNGTFATKVDYASGGSPSSITAADFNGDAKVDIAIGAGNDGIVLITTGGSTTIKNSLSVSVANLNDTGLYIKAVVNQAADLIRVEDSTGGKAMFSIGAVGSALFRNSTDSTTALQVQNAAGVSILNVDSSNSSLAVYGSALYRNATDSTTAFVIQDAAAVNLLQADTDNSIVYIGNSTPDNIGALLVLDTKSTSGDPTGVNGAMYYNSFLNKFRCYENGAWGDCNASGSAGAILQDGNSFTAPMTIGTNDGFALNLETGGVTVATFGTNGSALFKNSADSLTGFQVQNAASSSLLAVVTSLNVVAIGDAPSATPTLLVLGNGNSGTDPTGYDGAIYYNSSNNRFRCYENGGWKNCITSGGGGGGGDILNGGNTGMGNMIIGNLDNARLDLITNNQIRLRIGAAGNVAINSTGTIGTVESFRVNTPTTVDNAAASILATGGAANKGLVIQGAASQTANLQEWQTSTGQMRAAIAATGEFRIYDTTGTEYTRFTPGASGSLTVSTTNEGNLTLNPGGALNLGTGSTNAIVAGRAGGDGALTVRAATTMNATASTIALTVRGVTSQSANIQEWQAVGGTLLASVNAAGYFSINNGALLDRYNSQSSISAASGTGLYVTDGSRNGIYIANGGNVGINNAATANKLSINAPTTADSLAQLLIATNATTNKGVVIQGAASQTANFLEVQTNLGAALASITASGGVRATGGSAGTVAYAFTGDNNTGFFTPTSGQVGVSSNGTEVARWTSKGLEVGSTGTQGTVEKFRVNTPTTVDNTAVSILSTGATTNKALVLQRVLSQTANIFEVQTSTGAVLTSITSAGDLVFGQGSAHSISIAAATTVNASGSALTVQAGQGNGSGAGGDLNLFSGFPGSGSLVGGNVNLTATGGFVNGGNINISAGIGGVLQGVVNIQSGSNGSTTYGASNINTSGGRVNIGAALNSAKLSIVNDANTTADTVLVVRGAASQTGNIQQWQNNVGTVLASIDASGNLTLASGSLDITAGSLKTAGVDRISNSGTLLNVSYNGSTIGTGYGGTGAASFTANGILFGNGAGTLQATAAGSSGQCLIATTGSAPTWGSCAAAASGNVNQGGNTFGQGMTIGTIDNFGLTLIADNHPALVFDDEARATFQSKSDATTAFQVQNAAGTSLFNIDSANNRIYVGNATPDSIGTLLVLDTKNTSGDPTGVDGAMYYNSNLGKFRCYESSEWKDCIYNMKLASKTADQTFSSTSYASVNDMSFALVANRSYRIQCSLLLSVPSGFNGGNVSSLGPASPTQYTATFLKSLDQSGGDNYATSSAYDDGSAATTFRVNTVSTGANRFIVNYNAVIVNGANAGTWQLRAKAVDGSSSITFYANSSCNMQPL